MFHLNLRSPDVARKWWQLLRLRCYHASKVNFCLQNLLLRHKSDSGNLEDTYQSKNLYFCGCIDSYPLIDCLTAIGMCFSMAELTYEIMWACKSPSLDLLVWTLMMRLWQSAGSLVVLGVYTSAAKTWWTVECRWSWFLIIQWLILANEVSMKYLLDLLLLSIFNFLSFQSHKMPSFLQIPLFLNKPFWEAFCRSTYLGRIFY